jgi:hypothetical protein
MKTYDIECGGEIHTIAIHPDGTLDALDHDMEREQMRTDLLGEEPSRCMEVIYGVDSGLEDDQYDLYVAAEHGDTEIVRFYIDAGSSKKYRELAFYTAGDYDYVEIMELLYDAGVSMEALNEVVRNTAYLGNVNAMKFALDHGANVNTWGGYPLVRATHALDEEVVMLLLERGADPNLDPNAPYNLVKHIRRSQSEEAEKMLKALLDYGLNMDAAISKLGSPYGIKQWWEENRELYEDDD